MPDSLGGEEGWGAFWAEEIMLRSMKLLFTDQVVLGRWKRDIICSIGVTRFRIKCSF